MKLGCFGEQVFVRRLRKTVVGAAKPFGGPPILCSAEVVPAAYIGAGGAEKMGANHQIGGGGRSHPPPAVGPDTHQTPITTQMHLINSSNLANATSKYIRETTLLGALSGRAKQILFCTD